MQSRYEDTKHACDDKNEGEEETERAPLLSRSSGSALGQRGVIDE
jgi:hypothetical protein